MDQVNLAVKKKFDYIEILKTVQKYISDNHHSEVSKLTGRVDADQRMKAIVKRSLINLGIYKASDENIDTIVSKLHEDMAGISFLSKYLNHLEDYPDLEEININKWDSVVLYYSGGRIKFSDETFLSPQHSLDVLRNILAKNNESIDDAIPAVTSSITDNIRITAYKYPLIPKEFGVVASIRITRPQMISEKTLIKGDSVSLDIMDFLLDCMKYSVSMCIAGKQGSGKTTMLNYLLSKISPQKRINPIEVGSRELSLLRFDDKGRLLNQVIPVLTRPNPDNREQNFDSSRMLQFGLRFDIDIFVPQELRAGEAYDAQEAAHTGSNVFATIHSNDAESTYSRIMTLEQMASNQDEDTLMRLAVEAFPIIIYMRKLEDKVRRVMEVLEGEQYIRGQGLKCHTLFQYVVEDNIEKTDGSVEVIGHFEQVEGISPRFQRLLLNNGAPKKLVDKYTQKRKVSRTKKSPTKKNEETENKEA
jgi:pilus assembly protein CpaF